LRFLLRLSDVLQSIDDESDIQVAASRLLADELGADRVGYAVDAGQGKAVITCDYARDAASLRGEYRYEDYGSDLLERLQKGEVVVRDDIANDPQLDKEAKLAHARIGLGATVNVPLIRGGRVDAIFFVHYSTAHPFSSHEIEYLTETANRVWLAVTSAHDRAALQRSRAWLTATLESVPIGIAIIERDGRISVANERYRRFCPELIPSRDPERCWRWKAWNADGRLLEPEEYPGARAARGENVVPGQELLFEGEDGRFTWVRVAAIPIRDAIGRITGQASVISDIDDLKRGAEANIRAHFLVGGIAMAIWETQSNGIVSIDSPGWRALTGQTYAQYRGTGWLEALHPDDRSLTVRAWRDALDARKPLNVEYRVRLATGDYLWVNARAVPVFGDAGRVVKWLGMSIDINERKVLEEAIKDAGRRMQALVEGVPQLLWRAVDAGNWQWVSPQWTSFTGQASNDGLGQGWVDLIHPEDRDAALAAWRRAAADEGFDIEHRLRRADGTYQWFNTRAVPLRDANGRIIEWLGTSNDIDALRTAQERQDVMVHELQHRTRNLIAVTSAIADRMIEGSSSLEDFRTRFRDRLAALSRVQGLLSKVSEGYNITFDELIRTELHALGAIGNNDDDHNIVLHGPGGVPLRSRTVQSLALALHELATNAVKYGALASPEGRLAISWRLEHDDSGVSWLHVDWIESGVVLPATIAVPATGGYGRYLIERSLPYQLGAHTHYRFADDGVHCTISIPTMSGQPDEDTRQ
jgi:PAS domain S-box-containing protein